MSAADEALRANERHAETFTGAGLPQPPGKRLAVLTCMDARLDPLAFLGLAPGDAHVIRNAGGLVSDDVVRSLTASQEKLGTVEVMVVHHTNCGVVDDPEAGARAAVGELRESSIPHPDAVRGFVYEVESGRLREVG